MPTPSRLLTEPQLVPALLLALLFCAAPVAAEDWPEWRGEGRRGIFEEPDLPDRFPAAGLHFTWRVPIGPGYGGPAVAGGRVFVTDFERLPNNRGRERLLALDEKSGIELWEFSWETGLLGLMPTYANGPRATPTVDGERVYVLGSYGKLFCLRTADGGEVWSRDFVADYGATIPTWGSVAAPLVEGDLLIALVGGEGDSLVVAFDKESGREVWRSLPTRREPGYAPPVVFEAGGARQLVVWTPDAVSSLDPRSGELYWQEPYVVAMGQTIATPVLGGHRLLVSSSSHGSTVLLLDEEKPGATLAWRGKSSSKTDVDGLHAFLATPSIEGDYVYGVGGLGWLRCIDLRTGEEVWKSAEPSEDARIATAFLVRVAGEGHRFLLNNDRGDLILARLTPEGYEELDRAKLIEPTTKSVRVRRELDRVNWVHPAYANGHVVQRNDREIVRASLVE